jgi:hypothetical protein
MHVDVKCPAGPVGGIWGLLACLVFVLLFFFFWLRTAHHVLLLSAPFNDDSQGGKRQKHDQSFCFLVLGYKAGLLAPGLHGMMYMYMWFHCLVWVLSLVEGVLHASPEKSKNPGVRFPFGIFRCTVLLRYFFLSLPLVICQISSARTVCT